MEDLTTTTRHERGEPTLTIIKKVVFPALGRKASRATNLGKSPTQITTTTMATKTLGQNHPLLANKAKIPTKKSTKLALSRKMRKAANSTAPMVAMLNMLKTNNNREV